MAQMYDPASNASHRTLTPATPDVAEHGYGQPTKSRRRQRIVEGLQRISSSPSLAKLGRSRTGEYRSGCLASMSCISLGSPLSTNPLYPQASPSSQLSANFSTASTVTDNDLLAPKPTGRSGELDQAGNEIFGPRSISVQPPCKAGEVLPAKANQQTVKSFPRRANFNFWPGLPHELRVNILRYLPPKHVLRLSAVSRSWHDLCYDGQLWTELNPQAYYRQITPEALAKIMLKAGPFIRNLNLRGCLQLRDEWLSLEARMANRECRNLESFTIEGCKIERSVIHFFLLRNPSLLHLNMPSVQNINNATMKIIASHCPLLELLNIDWCSQVNTKGLKRVIRSCPNLSDLRASDIRGLEYDFMLELFQRNTLERLVLQHCDDLTNKALDILTNGIEPEIDLLNERPIVPPRRLRHLDISQCRSLRDEGVKSMAYNVPYLEGFRLCQNHALTDGALIDILSNTPRLTHLEVEEIESLTNTILTTLAAGPGASSLEHLSISHCDHLGDVGILPILRSCPNLRSLWLDNTRASDLVLIEAAEQVRHRGSTANRNDRPKKSLDLIAYDCVNIQWIGAREIMSQNTRIIQSRLSLQPPRQQTVLDHSDEASSSSLTATAPASNVTRRPRAPLISLYPTNLIRLKADYRWQQTIDEHYKRCITARWAAASRLEGKWAEWMLANDEIRANGGTAAAGSGGGGTGGWAGRRRRRRAREAELRVRDDEENDAVGGEGAAINGIGSGLGLGFGVGVGAGDGYGFAGAGAAATGAGDVSGMGMTGSGSNGAGVGIGVGRRRARSGSACVVM